MEKAYSVLFTCALCVLGICILAALVRSIRGPRLADRIVGINMLGTLSLLGISVVADMYSESWLLDVAVIYALISFLAVVVLCVVNISSKRRNRRDRNG